MEIVELFKNHPDPFNQVRRGDRRERKREKEKESEQKRTDAGCRVEWTVDTSPPSILLPLCLATRLYSHGRSSSYILNGGCSHPPSIRFLVSKSSRGTGENLESKSPARLMLNGPGTIYPFRSQRPCAPPTRRFENPTARYLSLRGNAAW